MGICSAYNAGFKSFEARQEYSNPYVYGSPDFNMFERGYFQAFKRSEHRFPLALRRSGCASLAVLRDAHRHMKSMTSHDL